VKNDTCMIRISAIVAHAHRHFRISHVHVTMETISRIWMFILNCVAVSVVAIDLSVISKFGIFPVFRIYSVIK
jgi:hypothetical protein